MTHPNFRFFGFRPIAISFVIVMLNLAAPSPCHAGCGDYLHYNHKLPEETPFPSPPPCGCHGAECSSPSDLPLVPPSVPTTLFDDFACLTVPDDFDQTGDRFGRPTSSEDEPNHFPFLLDPPPRRFTSALRRNEPSLQLQGGIDGHIDSAVTRVQAGDGSR